MAKWKNVLKGKLDSMRNRNRLKANRGKVERKGNEKI